MQAVQAVKDVYDMLFVHYTNDVSLAFSAFMVQHYEIPVVLAMVYLITVFSLREAMKEKAPFSLQRPLMLWNVGLALFSMTGFYVLLWPTIQVISHRGFLHDLCTPDAEMDNPWPLFFCLSKIPEFLDTLFIVLRKRPLIFLHYYHHIVTMFYCWDSYANRVATGGWFAFMNLFVHSIMYSYYAGAAYGLRFSRITRQAITSLQILQMIAGTTLTIVALNSCLDPIEYTPRVRLNLQLGLVMYFSYWVLFVKYFVEAYFQSKPEAQHPKKE